MPRSPPHPHPPHRPAAQKPPLVRGRLKTLSLPEWSDPVGALPPLRLPPVSLYPSDQTAVPTQCFRAPLQHPHASRQCPHAPAQRPHTPLRHSHASRQHPQAPTQCFHASTQYPHPSFHAPTRCPRAHANVAQRASAEYLNALGRDSRHLRHSTHELNPAYHPRPPAGCSARGITPQSRDTRPIPARMPHTRAPPSREPPAPSASTVTANPFPPECGCPSRCCTADSTRRGSPTCPSHHGNGAERDRWSSHCDHSTHNGVRRVEALRADSQAPGAGGASAHIG